MRNRLIGVFALLLGTGFIATTILSDEVVDISGYIIGPIFIIIGGWQLFTGRGMASSTDFILSGKLTKNEKLLEEITEQEKSNQKKILSQQEPNEGLVDIFLEECRSLLPSNKYHLLAWKKDEDISALKELYKNMHTFRGGAMFCDLPEIVDTATQLKRLVTALIDNEIDDKERANKFLTKGNDIIATLVGQLDNRQPLDSPTKYLGLLQQFFDEEGVVS